MRGRDAERLMPAVATALSAAGVEIRGIDRVVCGAGPGSFTSLRLAASIAKGLCLGRGIPLFAVSSLALIVAANAPRPDDGIRPRYLAALDALRGDWHVQLCERSPDAVHPLEAPRLIAADMLAHYARESGGELVGPGFGDGWKPMARGAVHLLDAVEAVGPVDRGQWEPDYGRMAEAQARWEATHGRRLGP
jgi:tRNA threonylcarbamoyladenosine biosynthesis protein TsaB